jgi:hypothetical protein
MMPARNEYKFFKTKLQNFFQQLLKRNRRLEITTPISTTQEHTNR